MDEILSLFETIVHSDFCEELLRSFLKSCVDHQAFLNKAQGAVQPVVAVINVKLNSINTRYEGLLLLKTYLPQCSAENFIDNAISWMQQCLKTAEGCQNKQLVINTSFQVLKILLQMSEKIPEMKRSIAVTVIPKVIERLAQIPQEASILVLECLEILMFNYGPSCGQHKNFIEKFILKYIDSNDATIVNRAARCAAFLPLLSGGGSLGINHITRWNQEQQKLCSTLHQIMDDLFDNVREVPNKYSFTVSDETLSASAIIDAIPSVRVHKLITRFINVSKFLQAMLLSEFPVIKKVMPNLILGVISRGLAVNSQVIGKTVSTELLMIGAMLPQIHIQLFQILDSLIICCGRNLLPYASVICKMVLQTLKWTCTGNWPYGIEKPYSKLRETAYNTLTHWLQTTSCGSYVETIADDLIPVVVQDILCRKDPVTLIIKKRSKSRASVKKSKLHKQLTSQVENIEAKDDNSPKFLDHIPDKKASSMSCKAALKMIQWFLHSAAPFIKPHIHRHLQEVIVRLIFEIQQTSKLDDLPVPYFENSCRLELYTLLHSLTMEPHPIWPPPTQFNLHLLSLGRNDSSREVSAFCSQAVILAEKLVHPASITLQFPVSVDEMLESTNSYKQNVSTMSKELDNLVSSFESNSTGDNEQRKYQNEKYKMEKLIKKPVTINENTSAQASSSSSSSDEIVVVYEHQREAGDNMDEIDEAEEDDDDDDDEEEEAKESDEVAETDQGMAKTDKEEEMVKTDKKEKEMVETDKEEEMTKTDEDIEKTDKEEVIMMETGKEMTEDVEEMVKMYEIEKKMGKIDEKMTEDVEEMVEINKIEKKMEETEVMVEMDKEMTEDVEEMVEMFETIKQKVERIEGTLEKLVETITEIEDGTVKDQENKEIMNGKETVVESNKKLEEEINQNYNMKKESLVLLRRKVVTELLNRIQEIDQKFKDITFSLTYKEFLEKNVNLDFENYRFFGFDTPHSESDISKVVNILISLQKKICSISVTSPSPKLLWGIAGTRRNKIRYFIDLAHCNLDIDDSPVYEYSSNTNTLVQVFDNFEQFLNKFLNNPKEYLTPTSDKNKANEDITPAKRLSKRKFMHDTSCDNNFYESTCDFERKETGDSFVTSKQDNGTYKEEDNHSSNNTEYSVIKIDGTTSVNRDELSTSISKNSVNTENSSSVSSSMIGSHEASEGITPVIKDTIKITKGQDEIAISQMNFSQESNNLVEENCEPEQKKLKLSFENYITKSDNEIKKNETVGEIQENLGDNLEKTTINGTDATAEEITEEDMLKSFVDIINQS